MQGKRPHRFIAGAVCPRCAGMDKIVLDPDTDRRLCVSCGFSEGRPAAPTTAELSTRVSRAAARRRDTPPQVLELQDPPAGDGRD